jgi:hypothetical protein
LVAAGRPSSKPHCASTAAPVHTDAMMRTRLSMARIHSMSCATPCGLFCWSSSGHVPPPPGTISRSSGSRSARAKSQSGATEGPLMLFTLPRSRAINTISNG